METAKQEWAEGGASAALGEALEGLLELTGATAGWVGLRGTAGRLSFPARRGEVADRWLALQQAPDGAWGFVVREGPTLLNDLRPLPPLGAPPLRNLLSCPLGPEPAAGHVVLANKPTGFTSADAAVLQGASHLMSRALARAGPPAEPLPPGLGRALDRAAAGALVLDDGGAILFANAAWLGWTGFGAAELVGRAPPYPFWVSHRDLAAAGEAARPPADALPFRRRDGSLLWCRTEAAREEWQGRPLALVFLRRAEAAPAAPPLPADALPFGVALTDARGRVAWANAALARLLGGATAAGEPLRDRLPPAAAAALEQVLRDPDNAAPGRMGFLTLPRPEGPLAVGWLAAPRPEGPGFLLALTADAEGFPVAAAGTAQGPAAPLPRGGWLALGLRAGEGAQLWDERWERLTGLTADDLSGVPCETVLDWLFPLQRDRERVADWLHEPGRGGGQAVLEVLTPAGGRPMLCTLLPVSAGPAGGPQAPGWLLLAGEPEEYLGPDSPSRAFVRRFTQGVTQLLTHYLRVPLGLAEMAQARADLPAEVRGWFAAVLDSCRQVPRLTAALHDLAVESAGPTQVVPLAALVREYLDERAVGRELGYELTADLRDEAAVRVNRRLLRVVLGHVIRNAEQALQPAGRRQIDVRVLTGEGTVICEVHDTGEGLPPEVGTRPPAPFFSTKGAFARDPAHAAQEATGLGLAVSRHLLALHGGRLELRSVPSGTTAAIILPRAEAAEAPAAAATSEALRAHPAAAPAGPHAKPEWSRTPGPER
jgi:PAS domain S-box-containing protein